MSLIRRPKCAHCGRPFRPREGVAAEFCARCSAERRQLASEEFRKRPGRTIQLGHYVVRTLKNS